MPGGGEGRRAEARDADPAAHVTKPATAARAGAAPRRTRRWASHALTSSRRHHPGPAPTGRPSSAQERTTPGLGGRWAGQRGWGGRTWGGQRTRTTLGFLLLNPSDLVISVMFVFINPYSRCIGNICLLQLQRFMMFARVSLIAFSALSTYTCRFFLL